MVGESSSKRVKAGRFFTASRPNTVIESQPKFIINKPTNVLTTKFFQATSVVQIFDCIVQEVVTIEVRVIMLSLRVVLRLIAETFGNFNQRADFVSFALQFICGLERFPLSGASLCRIARIILAPFLKIFKGEIISSKNHTDEAPLIACEIFGVYKILQNPLNFFGGKVSIDSNRIDALQGFLSVLNGIFRCW